LTDFVCGPAHVEFILTQAPVAMHPVPRAGSAGET
jgi:hypothetical protein